LTRVRGIAVSVQRFFRFHAGDDRADVEIFGFHQEFDVHERAMNVQVARMPAEFPEVGDPLELHAQRVVAAGLDFNVAAQPFVLRTALDLVSVFPRQHRQGNTAVADKVVPEKRQFRRPLCLARLVI
jgi:hypothetical protein